MNSLPIDQVAYSIPDSFLALRWMDKKHLGWELGELPEGLYLRIVHGLGNRLCFQLIPMDGENVCEADKYSVSMTAGGIEIAAERGRLYITFEQPDTLSVRGEGLGLRLDVPTISFEYAVQYDAARCLINASAARSQFMLELQRGLMALDAPYEKKCCQYIHCDIAPDSHGVLQFTCDYFESVWTKAPHTADARLSIRQNQAAFEAFCAGFPNSVAEKAPAARLALFVLWSAVIPAHNLTRRRGVLMSNNWMTRIWSWDCAVNAMGLSLGAPSLAVDQLMYPYDHQAANGLLPDYVTAYDVMWNFTKPPVQGIAYLYFLKSHLNQAQIGELYARMSAQVAYWLEEADSDGDGIPQYNHGNDCGWDNCTSFEVGPPVEGPDLSAYLILCMEALSDMAARLDRSAESGKWKTRQQQMTERLLSHSYRGGRFQVYQSGSHRVSPRGSSLYPYLPIVLGHRLPKEIFQSLAKQLKRENHLLTAFGLATESVTSPCYEPDGYWRGPIWAPPMLFIILGLHDGGETEFARELARRFMSVCEQSGMAENFNALTGEGLRDPAYTWTASTYLILASRYAL